MADLINLSEIPELNISSNIDNPVDTSNLSDTKSNDTGESPHSTICTSCLTKYAKTKKDKVKYDAGNDEERIEKTTKLNEKYESEFESVGKKIKNMVIAKIDILDQKNRLMILAKKPQYMMDAFNDRLNKTKNDIEESTQLPYDPIKKSLNECLSELTQTDEAHQEILEKETENAENKIEIDKESIKNAIAKAIKESKKKKQEEELEKAKEKLNKNKKNKTAYEKGNAMSIANKWGQTYDHQIDEYQAITDKELKEYEDEIKTRAVKKGEEKAVNAIKVYNRNIEKQAKKAYELKQKNLEKAKVKAKAAIQKVKLSIAAKLGL